MSEDHSRTKEEWERQWREVLENARQHPAMFLGSQERGHILAIRNALRLVWEAKAFRDPVSTSVLLSPHQYVVRCLTGPLLTPIRRMFPFQGAYVIGEGWKTTIKWLQSKKFSHRGWRRLFGSSTGPTLDGPIFPLYLARQFVIGMRADEGMWCQTFKSGWPETPPFLIRDPSPVGLLAAGELDPQWFTGLPFVPEDASKFSAFPAVVVDWRPTDDLFDNITEPAGIVQALLS